MAAVIKYKMKENIFMIIKQFIKKHDRCYKLIKRMYFLCIKTKHSAYLKYLNDDGELLRYKYNLNENSIVFDCGGYYGDFTSEIAEKFDSECYCFEPVSEFYKIIVEKFATNPKIHVYNFGISKTTYRTSIALSEDGSSIYAKSVKEEDIQECAMKSIVEFIEENKIGNIDLMKINIEGGEYELLEALLETGLIKKIKHLQVQFHEISGSSKKRMKNIWKLLKETHRIEWSYRPFIWESWIRKE